MNETQTVDARGLSCPMPAMLARKALVRLKGGALVVLVDNTTSAENVARLGEREGWTVTQETQAGGVVKLVLTKGTGTE